MRRVAGKVEKSVTVRCGPFLEGDVNEGFEGQADAVEHIVQHGGGEGAE